MTILYTVITRENTILSRYATCAGNFQQAVDQLLSKVTFDNHKITYSHESFLFHYICEDRIIYLAITEDDFPRSKAFRYLEEIKKRFNLSFGQNIYTALPYAMDTEFSGVLMSQMKFYSQTQEELDKIGIVRSQLSELQEIMVKNIDTVTERGESLHLLVDKTDDLSHTAVSFKKTSTAVARHMWWKDKKTSLFIALFVLVVIFVTVTAGCGGFTWSKCIQSHNSTST